jgi:site-specific recombinase XerD
MADGHGYDMQAEEGYDIRTVQELLGHKDVSTTYSVLSLMPREEVSAEASPWHWG